MSLHDWVELTKLIANIVTIVMVLVLTIYFVRTIKMLRGDTKKPSGKRSAEFDG